MRIKYRAKAATLNRGQTRNPLVTALMQPEMAEADRLRAFAGLN